jgi:uncharacterized membrane protein YbhN (UPF0104 family)
MRVLMRVAGSLALLGWLAMRIEWAKLAAAFTQLDWGLWLAGLALYVATQVAGSLRWQLLARPLGFDQPAWQYIRYTLIGMFFGLFLPSVGNDVVRAWCLDAGQGRKRRALLSVLVDRGLGLTVLLVMVLVAALAYPGELPGWVRASVAMVAAGALAGAAVVGFTLFSPMRSPRLRRWQEQGWLFARHPVAAGGAVAWSVAIQAAHVLVVWLIGLAVHAPVPPGYYWVIVPLVSLLTLIPISINGIGVREASMVVLLAPLGITEETALTLVFLWFLAFTAVGASGFVFYLLGDRRPQVAPLGEAACIPGIATSSVRSFNPEPTATVISCPALAVAVGSGLNEERQRMKHPFGLSMLGWALNEEQNIAAYIERAEQFLSALTDDFELIFIDDGSTDRTLEIARECQETRPWLRIFANDRNRGSGYNAKRAITLATKDYLFWQTTDWAYDIARLGENLGYLAHYDILQGFRQGTLSLRGLFYRSDNWRKAVISITNYLLVRFLFRLPLHDYQNVTVYPRRLIQSVTLESESAFTNPECLLKTWWSGARFKEVPVGFLKRQHGQAKGTRFKVILASIGDIFGWWWRWIVRGRRQDHGRGVVHYWSEGDDLARRLGPPNGTGRRAAA